MKKNIVVFASGSGSNAENLVNCFKDTDHQVIAIFCNKPDAFVLKRAENLGVPSEVFSFKEFLSESFLSRMKPYTPSFIVLAGFLLKIPSYLVSAYPGRILNIHPALLPKFGGKGMYGEHVHKAVLESGEKFSGITIHLVNEHYDEGAILFQAKCEVEKHDTPESLAAKVHALEYRHFPKIVSGYIADFH